ncbi:MAG: hypothetical protein PUF72_09650 [Clostridiales bacterium]|nr:hypothetical protein [Clostridiales bacterium]
MADPMDALKGILGDGAEDKIKNAVNMLSSGSDSSEEDSMEYLSQIKDIADKMASSNSDPRTNLLLSLKPYMRARRQNSIDNAVRFLNFAKIARLFKL